MPPASFPTIDPDNGSGQEPEKLRIADGPPENRRTGCTNVCRKKSSPMGARAATRRMHRHPTTRATECENTRTRCASTEAVALVLRQRGAHRRLVHVDRSEDLEGTRLREKQLVIDIVGSPISQHAREMMEHESSCPTGLLRPRGAGRGEQKQRMTPVRWTMSCCVHPKDVSALLLQIPSSAKPRTSR